MREVSDEQRDVDVAGRQQSVHPALSAQLIVRSELVGAKARACEHQREGDVRVSGLHDATFEHDDAEEAAVSRTLLIEQQIALQDEPAAQVRRVSPSLRNAHGATFIKQEIKKTKHQLLNKSE